MCYTKKVVLHLISQIDLASGQSQASEEIYRELLQKSKEAVMIELTDSELFKDLTSIELNDETIDLHNNYCCNSINFNDSGKLLTIFFGHNSIKTRCVELVFYNVSIKKINIMLNRSADSSTINSFYRGRFELDKNLHEFSSANESYFYIEFEKGDAIELFSKKVIFDIISK